MSDEIDHDWTDEVVCPYCGHVHGDSWEMFLRDDGPHERECSACDRVFVATRHVSVNYSTEPTEPGR